MILHDFINCPALIDIKQTLHYKLAIESPPQLKLTLPW